MENKLNLFALIDRTARGSDLKWEELLEDELVSYKGSFLEELCRTSDEIRARIREDLDKNKKFYEPETKKNTKPIDPSTPLSVINKLKEANKKRLNANEMRDSLNASFSVPSPVKTTKNKPKFGGWWQND